MCIKPGQELCRAHPAAPWNAPTGAALQEEMPRERNAWKSVLSFPQDVRSRLIIGKRARKERNADKGKKEKNKDYNEALTFSSLPSSIPPSPAHPFSPTALRLAPSFPTRPLLS